MFFELVANVDWQNITSKCQWSECWVRCLWCRTFCQEQNVSMTF